MVQGCGCTLYTRAPPSKVTAITFHVHVLSPHVRDIRAFELLSHTPRKPVRGAVRHHHILQGIKTATNSVYCVDRDKGAWREGSWGWDDGLHREDGWLGGKHYQLSTVAGSDRMSINATFTGECHDMLSDYVLVVFIAPSTGGFLSFSPLYFP